MGGNSILDAYSREPLLIVPSEPTEMIEVETNYAPREKTHLIFCVAPRTQLRLFFGGSILVNKPSELIGAQLLGAHGMYCITAARTVTRKTHQCNTTALSSALLLHAATAHFLERAYVERDYEKVKRYMPQRKER